MPRKNTQNNPVRQIVQTSEDQHKYDTSTFRRMEVNARPVNTFITPAQSDAAGLALAFAEANPELGRLMQTAFAAKNEEDFYQGQEARVKESGLDPKESKELGFFSSPAFQRGYMTLAGVEQGQKAREQILVDWENDPQRNNMTTNEWVAAWMKKNTSGISDGAFTEGMMKTLLPTINELTTSGAKEKITQIRDAKNSNITQILQSDFKTGWTPELEKKRKDEFKAAYGMTNKEFDDYLMSSVKQYIGKGEDPEGAKRVLNSFYKTREDGTPGIAYKESVANSSESVEKLLIQADAVAINKANAQENADKIARTDAQRSLEAEVLNLAIDKGAGAAFAKLNAARKGDPNLVSPGFWDNLGSRIRHITSVKKGAEGEGSGSSAFNLAAAKAIRGELDEVDIANGIGNGWNAAQAGQLLSFASRGRSVDKALFQSPSYKRGMGLIAALPSQAPPTTPDIDGRIGTALRTRKELALVAYDEAVANGDNPIEAATRIQNTENLYRTNGILADPTFQIYYSKYKTFDEFDAAVRNGTVDPKSRDKELAYWKWATSTQPKAK